MLVAWLFLISLPVSSSDVGLLMSCIIRGLARYELVDLHVARWFVSFIVCSSCFLALKSGCAFSFNSGSFASCSRVRLRSFARAALLFARRSRSTPFLHVATDLQIRCAI